MAELEGLVAHSTEALCLAPIGDEGDVDYLVLFASLVRSQNFTDVVIRTDLKHCALEFLLLRRHVVARFEQVASV